MLTIDVAALALFIKVEGPALAHTFVNADSEATQIASLIYSSAPGTKRRLSVSSIRRIMSPPCLRAKM